MLFKEKVNPEIIKWGVFTGFVEGLIILAVSLVWFNREKILPLPAGWEFAATVIILSLLLISAFISTTILIWRPCAMVCQGKNRDCVWTVLSAASTLALFILLIIFASRVLI